MASSYEAIAPRTSANALHGSPDKSTGRRGGRSSESHPSNSPSGGCRAHRPPSVGRLSSSLAAPHLVRGQFFPAPWGSRGDEKRGDMTRQFAGTIVRLAGSMRPVLRRIPRPVAAVVIAMTMSAAYGAGLGVFVRISPSCSVRTTAGRAGLACGAGSGASVRVLSANGAEVYAGASMSAALGAAESVSRLGGQTYVVIDF